MAVSIETAKREISGELIEIFKLRSAPFISTLEACKTMFELRQVVFTIIGGARRINDAEKANQLLTAWHSLGED
jgi:hypothetical protein